MRGAKSTPFGSRDNVDSNAIGLRQSCAGDALLAAPDIVRMAGTFFDVVDEARHVLVGVVVIDAAEAHDVIAARTDDAVAVHHAMRTFAERGAALRAAHPDLEVLGRVAHDPTLLWRKCCGEEVDGALSPASHGHAEYSRRNLHGCSVICVCSAVQ